MNSIKRHYLFIVLLLIFFLGLYLRNLFLPNNLFFGFEQGRDAFIAKDILTLKKLTLIGPKTDIEGIFHGAFYYYFLAILYFLARGDPQIVAFFFTLINALTIFVVYITACSLFKDKFYAAIAALLTSVSFNIIVYGRWISNVSPSIFFVAIFAYCLLMLLKSTNSKWFIPTLFFAGILSHFELLNLPYAIVLTFFAVLIKKISIKNAHFLIGIVLFVFALSPFIIFDLRHSFLLTKGLLNYITSTHNLSLLPFVSKIKLYFDGLTQEITTTLFPASGGIIIAFVFLFILYFWDYFQQKKHGPLVTEFLLVSMFWTLPYIFLITTYPLQQFYVGTSIFVILLFCKLLENLEQTQKFINKKAIILLMLFISLFNVIYIYDSLKTRANLFHNTGQKNLIYKDQMATLDYMFLHSKVPFSYDAFTIPYFHKEAWDYLYTWYGNKKYRKVYETNNQQPSKKLLYLIVEPETSSLWLDKWLTDYDKTTSLVKTEKIGYIILQVRKKL